MRYLLRRYHFPVSDFYESLRLAMMHDNVDVVRALFDAGADPYLMGSGEIMDCRLENRAARLVMREQRRLVERAMRERQQRIVD